MAFSEARRQGFPPGTAVSSPPSSVQWFSQKNKAQINAISTLVKLKSGAVPSYQVARNMTLARDKRSMCCT